MSAPPRSRLLLTGATGLLGAYLARALATDYDVRATRRPTSDTAALADVPELEWAEGELDDPAFLRDALRDVGAVVHAAGLVSYDPRDVRALRHVNVELTAALANAALDGGVSHLLHVSSIAAISPPQRTVLVREDQLTFHPHADTSAYARSKYAGEREVWRAAEEGLGVTILNPSVVLGVGDWTRSSGQLFGWVARGRRYYPTGGTGYVDARDVAAFAKTCLAAGPAQRRYIVSAENWRFGRFFRAVAEAVDAPAPAAAAKPWQAEAAWRGARARSLLTGAAPLLTKESARRSMRVIAYDNSASVEAGAVYRPLERTIWDVGRAYAAEAGAPAARTTPRWISRPPV